MNWMRWYVRPEHARQRMRGVVLPTPGMSSIRRCPRARQAGERSEPDLAVLAEDDLVQARERREELAARGIGGLAIARSSQRGYPLVLLGKLRQFTLESSRAARAPA